MEKIVLGDDHDVKGGVYVLRVGRHFYFGRSVDLRRRIRKHIRNLRCGEHRNAILQNAYNKHGEDGVSFEPLVWCSRDDAARIEAALIQACWQIDDCANMRLEDGVAFTFSDDVRKKLSEIQRNRSKETNQKISEANRGKRLSLETRRKIGDANRGRKRPPLSAAARRKISEARRGSKASEDVRVAMSLARRGVSKSPQHAAKNALANSRPVLVVAPDGSATYYLSARHAGAQFGFGGCMVNMMARGYTKVPERLAGHRFIHLDRKKENWSLFPTSCTHEHYGSTAP